MRYILPLTILVQVPVIIFPRIAGLSRQYANANAPKTLQALITFCIYSMLLDINDKTTDNFHDAIVLPSNCADLLKIVILFTLEDMAIFWCHRLRGGMNASNNVLDIDPTNSMVILNTTSNILLADAVITTLSGAIAIIASLANENCVCVWVFLRTLETIDISLWNKQLEDHKGDLNHAWWRPGYSVPLLSAFFHRDKHGALWLPALLSLLNKLGGGLGIRWTWVLLICILNVLININDHRRLPNNTELFVATALAILINCQ
mmetsp:Transcript_20016/g.33022  ORF Transcript_20016/g.33022 Transcript_20016/m.33022 type:complete len:262 (-) Transcript_20016:2447-3232(-)